MNRKAERKTLAILVDYMNLFAGGYEMEFRQLFERQAAAFDLNLMFVYGRALAHPDPGCTAHNRIYDLLGSRRIDGLIALSSSITSFCGVEGAQAFFARYDPIPRCSLGLAVPLVPSIAVDNRVGMDELLEHVVAHHRYRRIAFISGPPRNAEAQVRFDCYRRALERHGLPFDEQLVEPGDFARRSGKVAMERLLARVGKPEVVVAANDSMALGAITALREHGFRVPRDIAVTGFDDLQIARLGDPPLTTVSQPLPMLVELAVELVTRQLAGHSVPELTDVKTQFIARESCGCRTGPLRSKAPVGSSSTASSRERISARANELSRMFEQQARPRTNDSDVARLLAALARDFVEATETFREELENVLAEYGTTNERYLRLQHAITRVRAEFSDIATPELEDVWHQARASIALTNARRQEQLRLEQDQAIHRLIDNGERFGTALDLPTLKPALSGSLLTLGIDHAYISRYTDDSERELECFVAVRDGADYHPATPCFPAEELMPPGEWPRTRRSTFLAFPLAFNTQNLGVAVFEARPGVHGYQIIRDQISAVLRSIALHREIVQQTTLHERRIQEQERQATAKRIQSLSVLAGGVAHDLNNVLGPLVALPDVMLEQLGASLPGSAAADFRVDLETIKAAALRAAQTIKDLLTLGREGHTAKEPLDLNDAVVRSFASGVVRGSEQVRLELCSEQLFVFASETHIVRAVANLVHNALEAIDKNGTVSVRTAIATLSEPIAGYETIEPGNYALISVSDDGRGIALQDIGRVFEPFFSNKRLSERCGSGLGLAIVHGVVKEHGGFVNVESTIGRGTTFTLYLPRSAAPTASKAILAEAPRGDARILVVDDEVVQLRSCRRLLTHLGYRVDTLSSGREAYELFWRERARPNVELASESPYDLVIVDMLLNESEDGLVVFEKIRELFPKQRGIVVSGHAPSQRVELAIEHGLIWLAKPYTRATLARAVHMTLGTADSRLSL